MLSGNRRGITSQKIESSRRLFIMKIQFNVSPCRYGEPFSMQIRRSVYAERWQAYADTKGDPEVYGSIAPTTRRCKDVGGRHQPPPPPPAFQLYPPPHPRRRDPVSIFRAYPILIDTENVAAATTTTPGVDPRTFQPLARCYTDCAIPATHGT
jgi:hypothetical protein